MNQRHSRDQYDQSNRNQNDYRRNEERNQDYNRYGWEQQNRDQDYGGNYATSGDEWRGTADRMPEYQQPRGGQDRYSQGGQGYYGGQGQSGMSQRLFGYDMGGGQFDPSHQNWGQSDRSRSWGEFGGGQSGQDWSHYNAGQRGQQNWSGAGQQGRFGQSWGGQQQRGGQDWGNQISRGSQSWGQYGAQGPGLGQGRQWGGGELYNEANDYGTGSPFGDYNQEWRSRYGSMSSGQRSMGMGSQMQTQHRGRGPKGYQRTDQRIQEDVCERLSEDPHIDVSEVTVNVKDGVVTLEGSVDNRSSKHRIEDIADGCSGVKDVQNRLSVTAERWGSSSAQSTGDKNRQTQDKDKSREVITEH